MLTVRLFIALFIAKVVGVVLKITPYSGSDIPGAIALKICPEYLHLIAKPTKIVVVTGTEGKSSVVNLVTDCIMDTEIQVLNNGNGSNTPSGIATCLTRGVTLFGRQKYGTCVLEMDPIYAREVLTRIEPDFMMITLLGRDSVSRSVHPEYIKELINHYIPASTKLILNGDDVVSINVAPNNRKKYFGLKKMDGEKSINSNLIDDYAICPVCHKRLEYECNRYSNIGRVLCSECGFASPELDYTGELVEEISETGRGSRHVLRIVSDKRDDTCPLIHNSIFNIYNEIGAIALLLEMGVRLLDIKKAFEKLTIGSNTFVETTVGTITVTGMLAKDRDAYSTSRAFEYLVSDPEYKEVLILNNSLKDEENGFEDMSWLYDADFELLNNEKVEKVVVFGDRGRDYVLRLLVAGIKEDRIVYVDDYLDAPDKLNYLPNEKIYVLYGSDHKRMARDVLDKMTENIKIKERLVDIPEKEKKRFFGGKDK